jgi:hypothetical protein
MLRSAHNANVSPAAVARWQRIGLWLVGVLCAAAIDAA